MNPQEAFLEMLLAAMRDAAVERKLTQLQMTITPEGQTTPRFVRIIVIPEEMDMVWPKDRPLGTDVKKN
jgi:hypothetical protein